MTILKISFNICSRMAILSEDAMVIIVSEETGKISIAYKGNLERGLTVEEVEERLTSIQDKPVDEKKKKHRKVKDLKNGKKAD